VPRHVEYHILKMRRRYFEQSIRAATHEGMASA
jgi:hypothetical protein